MDCVHQYIASSVQDFTSTNSSPTTPMLSRGEGSTAVLRLSISLRSPRLERFTSVVTAGCFCMVCWARNTIERERKKKKRERERLQELPSHGLAVAQAPPLPVRSLHSEWKFMTSVAAALTSNVSESPSMYVVQTSLALRWSVFRLFLTLFGVSVANSGADFSAIAKF